MPHKRKRQDEPPEPTSTSQHHPQPPTQPPVTRRVTRHTPVQPPPIPLQYEHYVPPPPKPAQPALTLSQSLTATEPEQKNHRRTRTRALAATAQSQSQPQVASPSPLPAVAAIQASASGASWSPPPAPKAQAESKSTSAAQRAAMAASTAGPVWGVDASVRPPSNLVAPEITYHVPQAHSSSQRPSALVRPHGPSAPPPRLQPLTVTPVYPPKPPTMTYRSHTHPHPQHQQQQHQHQHQPLTTSQTPADRPTPRADRNVDLVMLGNISFRAWYPSYYGKEVLGDSTGNTGKNGSKDTGGKDQAGGKTSSRKDREQQHVLERLLVCPCCFKYSKEIVSWWGHVRLCERQAHVPGRKIYVHPRGRRKVLMPQDGKIPAPGAKKRRGEGGVKYIEEVVQDEGEWSIWEVDGEEDPLFCQNLSLFAKLFLDNKSVFFDVSGFNYFLLVYTPPPSPQPQTSLPPTASASASASAAATGAAATEATPRRPQITGFFSKEKMSWDNNNLACILVFPPWQRKGLGALLMGASYEISRRERILGGPEKPISDLGKKGYKRFWAGEVARWLLDLDVSANDEQEVLVDIGDCSQATWIHPDDCLFVLRDMGIVEEAGMGPEKPPRAEKKPNDDEEVAAEAAEKKEGESPSAAEGAGKVVKMVPRVRVDKQAVRRYVSENRINLERTCDAEGFVEGYAMPVPETKDSVEDKEEDQGE